MNQDYIIDHPNLLRRIYEIRNGQSVIAKIRFYNLGNTRAVAEILGNKWEITNNFLGNKISISPLDSPASSTILSSSTVNSKASFKIEANEYLFQRTSLTIRTEFVWTDDAGSEFIKYTKRGFIKLNFRVDALQSPKFLDDDSLRLLIVLGFYLIKSKYYSIGAGRGSS